MSSGYEEQELTAIGAALDANPDATSSEVFQATRPFDERAIASVAASRALAGGGGSQPSLPWASFTNVEGNTTFPSTSATIVANGTGLIGFEPNVLGAGDLATVTHGADVWGDPTFFFTDVGSYLVSVVVLASSPYLANGVDPADVRFEIVVRNAEHDPYILIPVHDPTNGGGNLSLLGSSSCVINTYSADTADQRGFQFQAFPDNIDLNVLANFVQIKVVQLATT